MALSDISRLCEVTGIAPCQSRKGTDGVRARVVFETRIFGFGVDAILASIGKPLPGVITVADSEDYSGLEVRLGSAPDTEPDIAALQALARKRAAADTQSAKAAPASKPKRR